MPGCLALVLHAHLPFVHHPEHESFHEENWLFEAISESYVPLLQMMQRLLRRGIRFQITLSVSPTLCARLSDQFRETFGGEPSGFWLPECAYSTEIAKLLQAENIRWFIVDAHALEQALPPARRGSFAPCFTKAGPAAFARNVHASRQVWSADQGYPGDAASRV